MFKFLKEKIKSWTKNLVKKAEPTEEEIVDVDLKEKKPKKKIEKKKTKETIKEKEIKETVEIIEKVKKPVEEITKEIKEKKLIEEKIEDVKKEVSELTTPPEKERVNDFTKGKLDTHTKRDQELGGALSEPKKPKLKPVEELDLKEKPEPGKPGFFEKIKSKITKVKITEETFNVYAEDLEMLLLENNVAMEVAQKMVNDLKEKVVGKELLKKEIESEIFDAFKEIIEEILIEPFDLIEKVKEKKTSEPGKPYIIMFCGINGTGKTTSIAKISEALKNRGLSSVLAAADTFRAASIEQIKKHGEKLGIKVIAHDYESDPAAVGFDAIKYAEKHKINAVLIDTAGRMYTDKNLMAQIEKIANVCKPDTKVFVGESITGNDAVEQVKAFNWAVGIDGIILSKADIDEKGGTALSVGYVTKKPILYLGTGQEYNDIEPFDKQKFIEKLGL